MQGATGNLSTAVVGHVLAHWLADGGANQERLRNDSANRGIEVRERPPVRVPAEIHRLRAPARSPTSRCPNGASDRDASGTSATALHCRPAQGTLAPIQCRLLLKESFERTETFGSGGAPASDMPPPLHLRNIDLRIPDGVSQSFCTSAADVQPVVRKCSQI